MKPIFVVVLLAGLAQVATTQERRPVSIYPSCDPAGLTAALREYLGPEPIIAVPDRRRVFATAPPCLEPQMVCDAQRAAQDAKVRARQLENLRQHTLACEAAFGL